jgi:SAM-dependent methyltransferase
MLKRRRAPLLGGKSFAWPRHQAIRLFNYCGWSNGMRVNYGCGLSAPAGWLNFDASPSLRLQRTPAIGGFVARKTVKFPDTVRFGDVTRKLPIDNDSCDLVYCSHVLEHLSLEDCRRALRETFRILKPGGTFRGVMPDLEQETQTYQNSPAAQPAIAFMRATALGCEKRPRTLADHIRNALGNSAHLWLWDYKSFAAELQSAGFTGNRRAQFGDSRHVEFAQVEEFDRWNACLGFECRKP